MKTYEGENGGLYYTVWDLITVKRIMSELTI